MLVAGGDRREPPESAFEYHQPRSRLNVCRVYGSDQSHSTRLYVYRAMIRRANHRRSRPFLFGSFSFVDGCGNVDNSALRALYKMSFRTAMWEDRAGGGGVLPPGPVKPVPKIRPASCPCGFREDRTLSGALPRISQEWSGNLT